MNRYQARLLGWCRRWGLQEADSLDVTQTVLVRLAVKLRGFQYDPSLSFRGWLRTLTRHAWADFVSDRQRLALETGRQEIMQQLYTLQARDDLERRLADVFDLELLEEATARVRRRVETRTWEAFQLTALEGRSTLDTATQLGMPQASVFKAKSNVQKMLRAEIARLEQADSSS